MDTLKMLEAAKAFAEGLDYLAEQADKPSRLRTIFLMQAAELRMQIKHIEKCKTEKGRIARIFSHRKPKGVKK